MDAYKVQLAKLLLMTEEWSIKVAKIQARLDVLITQARKVQYEQAFEARKLALLRQAQLRFDAAKANFHNQQKLREEYLAHQKMLESLRIA